MTLAKLQRELKVWQQRLRLQDWRIDLDIVRRSEIDGSLGHTGFSRHEKIAWIRLADAIDLEDEPLANTDQLTTLVHELIHLVFGHHSYDEDDPQYALEEHGVNCMAEALVGAYGN